MPYMNRQDVADINLSITAFPPDMNGQASRYGGLRCQRTACSEQSCAIAAS